MGNQLQIGGVAGQAVGLLVVQVLNAVFYAAQKHIGLVQCLRCVGGHQTGLHQAGQCVQRCALAQLGKLPAPNDLQQLHGEFDFSDTATTELDIVGAFGPPRAQAPRLRSNLLVQHPQSLKHVVVKVAAKHKRRDHLAQSLDLIDTSRRRHHPRFQPCQTLPFTALHLEILFQGVKRHHAVARLAVGAQGQVHAKDLAMLGGLAYQGIELLDHFVKVAVVANHAATPFDTLGLPIFIEHIDQIDIAGHIQFTRAQFAHADDPKFSTCALGCHGRAMALVHTRQGFLQSFAQAEFSECGHALHDGVQGRLLFAVQHHQSLQHQLAQYA